MKKRFIYVLRCPESGAIRYVGQAIDLKARLRQHISESRIGKVRSHKCSWIRSLLARDLRPVMQIDIEVPAGECWKKLEIDRIAYHRASGCVLTNGTNGGDSPGDLTEEGRALLSDRASKMFGTPEGRELQSRRMRQLCQSPEWRNARDAAAKATRSTAEYKASASERARARWQDPAYRARMIAARAAVSARPEYRAKLAASLKRYLADPAVRQTISEKTRASWLEGRR